MLSSTKLFGDSEELVAVPLRTDFDILKPIYLENKWSFWYDKYIGPGKSAEEYAASLQLLGSVDSVQEFWRWFNNLPVVSHLPGGSTMHLHKKGIKPLWEDPSNINGGSLSFRVPRSHTAAVWLELVLTVIGEQYSAVLEGMPQVTEICGISVSVRKSGDNVISLWASNATGFALESFVGRVKQLISPQLEFHNPLFKVHRAELGLPS